jgi:translocation and assembly module TamB
LLKAANTPFEATIDIDGLDAARRAALPHPLAEALAPYDGVVSLDAYASGTILDPTGSARLRIARLTPKVTEAGLPYPSVDLDVLARYRDGVGRIDGWIDALDTAADGEQRPRSVASFDAEIRPPKPRLFGPPLGPRLTANARLDRLPLGAIPQLALRQVAGTVSGKLSVADLGGDPRISLRLDGDGLSLGRDLELSRARVELAPTGSYDPSQVTGLVDLSVRGGGRLSARGYGSLAWTDGVRPRPGADRPAAVYAKADAFPLRALLPFIPEGITNLEGQLDGGLHLAYKEVLGRDVQLSMDLALTGGRLEMPNFGQELENVSMRLSAQPGKVLVQNIDAHTPGGGHITGQFDARMTDLSVTDITGKLTVADGEQIPVALVGQPIGSVAGQVSLQARRSFVGEESQLDIVVTAADLKLDLPANIGPGGGRQEPQKLEDHSDVSVSLPIAAPAVQARTGSGRINLTMALKDAVVEGRPIKIRVSTDPEKPIRATDARELSGELVFAGGELRLLGKTFEIDRGLVRLRAEEPGNPYVSVTAHWNAPDGTLVFVDYLGVVRPIDRDKLKFRSNPPKSEDALLSLLVLGDAGDSTAGLADAQSRANQAIRGVLANEINRMFSDVTPGLSAGVAATSQGYTATTLNYQINDRLTAQAIYEQAPGTGVLGTNAPTAGTTTSTTSTTGGTAAEARTKIGLDWRFAKNFLLRGYVGLTGGADNGVDLLYQYRY